jgi:hypothetical protein
MGYKQFIVGGETDSLTVAARLVVVLVDSFMRCR